MHRESDSEIVAIKGVREASHNIITSYNNIYADLHEIVTNPKNFLKYERNMRNIAFAYRHSHQFLFLDCLISLLLFTWD